MNSNKQIQKIGAFTFGVVFVVALIVLAIAFPQPTPFQYVVFRVVLALAAAGVAAMIPGFLEVTIPNWIRAGGALAVFIVVFFYNPAALVIPGRQKYSYEYEFDGRRFRGFIEKGEGGSWIEYTNEQNRDLTYYFREITGDPGWITLFDSGRHKYVRFRIAGGQMQVSDTESGPWGAYHQVRREL